MHLIGRELRRLIAVALGAAAVCSVIGVAASTSDAHAATRIPATGLPGFGQAVADMAASRVFVSESTAPSNSFSTTPAQGIVVTDLSGHYLTTIDVGTGALGLTLAPDGKLYAALSLTGEVAQINPVTYSEADYPLPAGDVPQYVAAQSGKVWVSYDTGTAGAIGDITPGATSSFQSDSILSPSPWSSAPLLASDPRNGGTVVAAATGQAPPAIASFDVSGTTPVVKAHGSSLPDCAFQATEVAVFSGGSQFAVDCSVGSRFPPGVQDPVFSTTDLSERATYVSPSGGGAIAVAPDGAVAAGSTISSSVDPHGADLNVFAPGTGLLTHSYALEGTWGGPFFGAVNLAPGGLAWGDSTVLTAVLAETIGSSTAPNVYEVHVMTYPLLPQSQIGLDGINPEPLGQSITISGSLTQHDFDNPAPYPGQTVTLSRTSPDGTMIQIGQTTTDANGLFTFSDTPPALGTYTYTASFAGDPATNTAPDTTSGTVTVLKPAQASLQLPPGILAGQSVNLTGVLTSNGAPAAGKTMNIIRTAPDGTEVLLGQVVTDSNGAFTISDTPSELGTYTYSASFFGDADTAPASATATLTVLEPAQITLKLPRTALPNQTLEANGSLAFASGAAAGGKTITVTRFNPGGTTTTFTVTTDAKGLYSFKDDPSAVGTFTYTASYADSATGIVTGRASASVTVAKES